MDLSDETREALDYTQVPFRVRAALVEFWDDTESEDANIDLICHWLDIAKQTSCGDSRQGLMQSARNSEYDQHSTAATTQAVFTANHLAAFAAV
jgi:hypothetical protein